MKNLHVVLVCNFPGPVNAFAPVAHVLQRNHVVTVVTTSRYLEKFVLAQNKILIDSPIASSYACDLLRNLSPDVILAGTTELIDKQVGYFELHFVQAAVEFGFPVVTFIDHWTCYLNRFSYSRTNSIEVLPSIICVNDERAKADCIQLGFPKNKLVVTGNPAWDTLSNYAAKLIQNKHSILEKYGIAGLAHNNIFCFVSSPLNEDGLNSFYQCNEVDVLKAVVTALVKQYDLGNFTLLCLLHPRETAVKYQMLTECRGVDLRIFQLGADNKLDFSTVSISAFGMSSMLLVEYAILGVPVFSIQPVLDDARVVRLGLNIQIVRNLSDIFDAFNNENLKKSLVKNFNAVNAIIKVLTESVI